MSVSVLPGTAASVCPWQSGFLRRMRGWFCPRGDWRWARAGRAGPPSPGTRSCWGRACQTCRQTPVTPHTLGRTSGGWPGVEAGQLAHTEPGVLAEAADLPRAQPLLDGAGVAHVEEVRDQGLGLVVLLVRSCGGFSKCPPCQPGQIRASCKD